MSDNKQLTNRLTDAVKEWSLSFNEVVGATLPPTEGHLHLISDVCGHVPLSAMALLNGQHKLGT